MTRPGLRIIGQVAAVCFAMAISAAVVRGEVIISEIMYNPAGDESAPNDVEWVELYHAGEEDDAPVDLSGWYLQDEDGRTEGLPDETTLERGEAIVLIPGKQTVEDFRAAWSAEATVIPLAGWQGPWGIAGLSNAPSAKNEILELRSDDPEADPVDVVNYDDTDPWPSDNPDGASIYLKPGKLNSRDNDRGENWARSERYMDHAIRSTITEDYNRHDLGSPGRVATEPIDATPPPPEAEAEPAEDGETEGDGDPAEDSADGSTGENDPSGDEVSDDGEADAGQSDGSSDRDEESEGDSSGEREENDGDRNTRGS